MKVNIIEAKSPAERELVYRLRYEIYVEEMGVNQIYADHQRKRVEEPFDENAHLFLALDADSAVGTVRVNFRADGPLEYEELYDLPKFGEYFPNHLSMTTKLLVKDAYRKTTVAARLSMAAYSLVAERSGKFSFIDCKPHLLRFYHSLGFRLYKGNIHNPTLGSMIPMVILPDDAIYLREIRSPFAKLAKSVIQPDPSRYFFEMHFSEYSALKPQFMYSEDEIWQQLSTAFANEPHKVVEIFKGFSDEETRTLLAQFDVLSIKSGEYIFHQGDNSAGMFCVLEGQIEIIREGDHGPRVVAIMTPGEVFGEMGFLSSIPRTASARASQDSRVLVLSPSEYNKFVKHSPELAVRLLTNLFALVVARFNEASTTRSALWAQLEALNQSPQQDSA